MTPYRRYGLLALAVWAVPGSPAAFAQGSPGRLRITATEGQFAGSHIVHPTFRGRLKQIFLGQDVRIYTHPTVADPSAGQDELANTMLNTRRTLLAIQQSDVFLFSGHSGVVEGQPVQVVQVADDTRDASGKALLSAVQVRETLQGRTGPRLVIINGCITTNLGDGIATENRLSTAFGIDGKTKGRAYLGWDDKIVGANADKYALALLTFWTTPGPKNQYPTLAEARDRTPPANKRTVTIIGDQSLRYSDLRPLTRP